MVVACFYTRLIFVPIFEASLGIDTGEFCRQRLGDKNVGSGVIVQISDIGTHASHADLRKQLWKNLAEGAVLIVEIKVISLKEVIGYVQVRPIVTIEVCDGHAQSVADSAPVDTCLFRYIFKLVTVISEEFVSSSGIPYVPLSLA